MVPFARGGPTSVENLALRCRLNQGETAGCEETVGREARAESEVKLRRELLWLAGSALTATAFCWLANEYGYSPVPFFTLAFYLVSGVFRLGFVWLKRLVRGARTSR